MTRFRFQSGLILCGVCITATGVAQQRPVPELSWQAPAGCPQEQGVRERIRAIAGTATQRESHLRAEGEISKADGHFHLRLVVRDGDLSGERNIVSDSCEDLAGAAAVALGLLLRSGAPLTERELQGSGVPDRSTADPNAAAQPSAAGTRADAVNAPAPPAARPPASPPEGTVAPAPDPRRQGSKKPWRLLLRAPSFFADFGPLPGPSAGLGLGVGVEHAQWRVLLLGELWLDRTVHGSTFSGYGADVHHQSVAAELGRQWGVARVGLTPYARLAAERLSAQGVGIGVVATERSTTWLSGGVGVLGSLHLSNAVALVADVGVRIEGSRPIIAIDRLGDVRQLAPAAFHSGIGAEWTF